MMNKFGKISMLVMLGMGIPALTGCLYNKAT